MSSPLFRDKILARLVEDLVGPLGPAELLADRPTQRYSTGILYPRNSRIDPEDDQDGGGAVNLTEDSASQPEDSGVSLHAALKPSAAGLSFAVRFSGDEVTIKVQIKCALYRRIAVDDAGSAIEGTPIDRAHERWRRVSLKAELSVPAGVAREEG